MREQERPTYRNTMQWRRYQSFLPSALRMSHANEPAEEWWTWQSGAIHLDRYAVEDARGTVILLHGAGGYGRLLAPYAKLLRDAGYEVVAPDLPGYGLSQVPSSLVDHALWVDCISDLVWAEQARRPHPVVLFGCSLGGYLSYLVAAQCKAVAGIIATTLADPRLPLVQSQFARHPLLARWGLPLLPLFDRLCGQWELPIRWFSNMEAIANDPRLVDVFLSDRFGAGNTVSVHFMHSLFAARPGVEPEAFTGCPVLLVHPASDRWTTVEASQHFFDRLQVNKRLVLLENCGHFPVEEPGVSQLRDAVLGFLGEITAAANATPPAATLDNTPASASSADAKDGLEIDKGIKENAQ